MQGYNIEKMMVTIKRNVTRFVLALAAALLSFSAYSQVSKENRFPQKYQPLEFQSYKYSGIYFNKNTVYSPRQVKICHTPGPIRHISLNPSGANVAVVWEKGRDAKGCLTIYDFWNDQHVISNPDLEYNVTSVCYSPDARSLAVCDSDGTVHILETQSYAEVYSFPLGFAAAKMVISGNLRYLAATDGSRVEIRIMGTGEIRKSITSETKVVDILFSPDDSFFSLLTSDNFITEYDTALFLPGNEISALGNASGFCIHPDCKYYAVVTGEHTVALVNRLDRGDRQYLEDRDSRIESPHFLNDSKGWLGYSTEKDIVYKQINVIKPNFRKLIDEELEVRMKEWSKRMPDESLEDYNLRVNEKTRMAQISIFEEEISTRLAGDRLACSQIMLGDYNSQDQILSVNFDSMPTIYLNVPKNQLTDFLDMSEIEFCNARYGHKPDDTFELVYVEVFNKRTGASYIFDNRERKSLEYLKLNDNFAPLDIVQLANMEELKLEGIKEDVISRARSENRITNHTEISVTTDVEKDVDAYGNNILNYKVAFSYDVLPGFSGDEDFSPGKFKLEQSGAASSMSAIVKEAFDDSFSQYVKAGKKVRIKITGMADNLAIHGAIAYDGCFGDFVDEPVYGDQLYSLTVTRECGISTNDQLALIRAAAIKDYIENKIPQFSEMDKNFEYHIQLADAVGGAFRRISVEFTFFDAF